MRCVLTWSARLRWATSRVPRRSAERELSRLLSAGDLEGTGWRKLDERAWRTGKSGNDAPWALRAREAGLLTAWRSFEQTGAQRWMWAQISPLVSVSDADEALSTSADRFLRNFRATVTVVEHVDAQPLELSGQPSGWAFQQRTHGPKGEGESLYCGFVVGQTVAVLAASALRGSWDWPELQRVAQRQADLLDTQ